MRQITAQSREGTAIVLALGCSVMSSNKTHKRVDQINHICDYSSRHGPIAASPP